MNGPHVDSIRRAHAAPVCKPTRDERCAECDLVARATRGDEEAFTELYDLHYDRIYRYAYFRTRSVQDSEDIAQHVFLNAWKAIGGYRQARAPFAAWLMSIAHNEVVTHYRARRPQEPLSDEMRDSLRREDIADDVVQADESETLISAILTLNGDQQKVIYMRFVDGFGYPEIAASIGKTEGNVRVIQHRGLCTLRKRLGREVRR